jgi:hypothetical protein
LQWDGPKEEVRLLCEQLLAFEPPGPPAAGLLESLELVFELDEPAPAWPLPLVLYEPDAAGPVELVGLDGPLSEPAVELVAAAVVELVSEPVAELVSEPVVELVAAAVVELVAAAVVEPAAEMLVAEMLVAELVSEPAAELVSEPAVELAAAVEIVAAAVVEPVAELPAAELPVVAAAAAAFDAAVRRAFEMEPVPAVAEPFEMPWPRNPSLLVYLGDLRQGLGQEVRKEPEEQGLQTQAAASIEHSCLQSLYPWAAVVHQTGGTVEDPWVQEQPEEHRGELQPAIARFANAAYAAALVPATCLPFQANDSEGGSC